MACKRLTGGQVQADDRGLSAQRCNAARHKETLTAEGLRQVKRLEHHSGCISCGKPTLKPGAQCCQRCEEKRILAITSGGILGFVVLAVLGALLNLGAGVGIALGIVGCMAGAMVARRLFRRWARGQQSEWPTP